MSEDNQFEVPESLEDMFKSIHDCDEISFYAGAVCAFSFMTSAKSKEPLYERLLTLYAELSEHVQHTCRGVGGLNE